MKPGYKWTLLVLGTLAAIIVPFMLFGESIDAWVSDLIEAPSHNRPLVALVLGGLLGSDILLPIPSSIVSTACGVLLGFGVGTLASTAGMVVSCLIGYVLAAKLGQPFVRKMVGDESMARFEALQARHGIWVVVITRPVPVLAEIAVLSAGLGKISFARFMLLSTLSNLGISAVYAAIGAWSATLNAFLWAVAGSLLLPGIGMLWMHLKNRNV
jgi:uncharacterized membrane protein YdjX (TVP38/TMEM64 family)